MPCSASPLERCNDRRSATLHPRDSRTGTARHIRLVAQAISVARTRAQTVLFGSERARHLTRQQTDRQAPDRPVRPNVLAVCPAAEMAHKLDGQARICNANCVEQPPLDLVDFDDPPERPHRYLPAFIKRGAAPASRSAPRTVGCNMPCRPSLRRHSRPLVASLWHATRSNRDHCPHLIPFGKVQSGTIGNARRPNRPITRQIARKGTARAGPSSSCATLPNARPSDAKAADGQGPSSPRRAAFHRRIQPRCLRS
jgi:hypothetical protein